MSRIDRIILKGVRLRAPSGAGQTLRTVDVRLEVDLRQAALHDRIDRTVDYREVHDCLRRTALEDGGRSEDLARAVLQEFPLVAAVTVASGESESTLRRRGGAHAARR